MATICLNCGTALTSKYCANCGQKANVDRITWHHVGEEIAHFFTHIEHGFLKTTKDLLIMPGVVQKNYLDGKRKSYHKPISFLLIWVAIFLIMAELTKRFGYFDKETSITPFNIGADIEAMILKYRALIEILILPFTAFNGWLILAFPKMTYLEFLVTGFYRFSVFYMFLTVQSLIGLIFGINPESEFSLYAISIIFLMWTVYVFYALFKLYNVKLLIVRIIGTMLTGVAIYFLVRTMIAKLFIAWGF